MKQIDIKELIPFMKDGYVAMDKNGEWWWYPSEPYMTSYEWLFNGEYREAVFISRMFDIAPAADWTKSLIKVENK